MQSEKAFRLGLKPHKSFAMRKEHDFLGELELQDHLYYGVQTHRALQNFNITGIAISQEPLFIKAMALVKKAAAPLERSPRTSETSPDIFIIHPTNGIFKIVSLLNHFISILR